MKKINYWSMLAIMMVALLSVGLTSCSDDDEEDNIDTTPIKMYAGEEKTIQGADTISSSKEFVAYGAKNVVHGWHVGEASLVVNGKKTIPVSVLPQYHLYDDPVCNWGCDMNFVKNHQKQGKLSSKSSSTNIGYENAGAASLLSYNFENGKLKAVVALVSTNHTSQYASYLSERYLMLPYYSGEDTYFIGADDVKLEDANTVVVMQVYNANYLVTVYMPAKDYTSSSSQNIIERKAKKVIHQHLPQLIK